MFRSLFVEDVIRFYRQGLLPQICGLLATRTEIWIVYAGIAVMGFLLSRGPRDNAILVLLCIIVACFYVTHYTVHILTPLWFGSFFTGRMTDKYWRNLGRSWRNGAWFLLIPSGGELNVDTADMPASGTINRTYLLLRHPADPSIILPIIDDDPAFLRSTMDFVTGDRRSEIWAEIYKLHPSGN
jgi:hypothetical protein